MILWIGQDRRDLFHLVNFLLIKFKHSLVMLLGLNKLRVSLHIGMWGIEIKFKPGVQSTELMRLKEENKLRMIIRRMISSDQASLILLHLFSYLKRKTVCL